MRREKADAAGLEDLFFADLAEVLLDVAPAQEEVAIALDVGHGDAAGRQPPDRLEEAGDRRSFEFRVGDEEMEYVAEQPRGPRETALRRPGGARRDNPRTRRASSLKIPRCEMTPRDRRGMP